MKINYPCATGYALLAACGVLAVTLGHDVSAVTTDPLSSRVVPTQSGAADANRVAVAQLQSTAPAPTSSPTVPAPRTSAPSLTRRLIDSIPGGSLIPNNLVPFVAYMHSISAPHKPVTVTATRRGTRHTVTVTATTRRGVHVEARVITLGTAHDHGHVTVTAHLPGQRPATVTLPIASAGTVTAVGVTTVQDAIQAAAALPVPTQAPAPSPSPDVPTPDPSPIDPGLPILAALPSLAAASPTDGPTDAPTP